MKQRSKEFIYGSAYTGMKDFDFNFYKGKKVLVTGHTGFKGAWLCRILLGLGAEVTGYALEPPTDPELFGLLDLEKNMNSVKGDIRDLSRLSGVLKETQPEIVLHLAAQPIVRESYANPVYTYETNVMGTVNILEAVRNAGSVASFLNVTTDKVYKNNEWEWGYRETDELDGYDPYSNSKSCSELVTHSYEKAFLKEAGIAVSTARAGNVIGGGDLKLFLGIGLFMGWQLEILGLVIACIIGAGVELIFSKKLNRKIVPFGPYLVIGFTISLFFGPDLILWYLHLFQ